MPKIDLTITVSVIVALVALISPILTSLINNAYQLKLKKLELKHEQEKSSRFYKRGIYEEYLKTISGIAITQGIVPFEKYSEIYPLALIYFPEGLRNELLVIDNMIENQAYDGLRSVLFEITPKICKLLQKL